MSAEGVFAGERWAMFERLTVPARQVMTEAKQAARTQGVDGIPAAYLLVGFLRCEQATAGQLLRARVDGSSAEAAISALPVRGAPAAAPGAAPGGFGEDLRMVLAGAAGVAAARGERRIGTASCLLSLLALESPSALELLAAAGLDARELAAAARAADDSAEGDPLAEVFERDGVSSGWKITVGQTNVPFAWSDEQD